MANNTKTTIIFPDFLYKYGTSTMFNNITHVQLLETVTKFILNQSIETVIVLSTVFLIYYLGFQNRKIQNSRSYYKELYTDAYQDCLRLEDTIMLLRKKVKSLETRLNMKRHELQCLQNVVDIDREKIADDLVDIMKSLPVDAHDSVALIKKLANKFDISISIESSNKKRKNTRLPTRRQPKRSAAPVKFIFDDSDSEDNNITDPDYKI